MRTASLACLLLLTLASADAPPPAAPPLLGAWEVIHGEYGLPDQPSAIDCASDPVQLKVFSSGHFAYVRRNLDGSFLAASAGTYVVAGDGYTEVTRWSSVPASLGTQVTFLFRIEGDTLRMTGPVDVRDAQGKRIEGVKQMVEVMRRARVPPVDGAARR